MIISNLQIYTHVFLNIHFISSAKKKYHQSSFVTADVLPRRQRFLFKYQKAATAAALNARKPAQALKLENQIELLPLQSDRRKHPLTLAG